MGPHVGCGVLCAVDPHAVGAWGVGSAVGITPNKIIRTIQALHKKLANVAYFGWKLFDIRNFWWKLLNIQKFFFE